MSAIPSPCRAAERLDDRTSTKHQKFTEPDPWPVIRRTAFPGIIGDFVDLACNDSEADPVAVLITLLVRIGIEIGTGPHYMVGDKAHHPRLFAAIVGKSSKSRKGTSASPVETLFEMINSTCQISPGPLSSGEGLIFAVRDETRDWKPDKKGDGIWIVTDPGVEDKRLFVLDEEFANALQNLNKTGNILSSVIRGLWDKGKAGPLTKTIRTKTTDAHIGIVTHTTYAELHKLLDEVQMFNGFGNRFIWVLVRRPKLVSRPNPMPDAKLQPIALNIASRIREAQMLGRIVFTQEACIFWDNIYRELSTEHEGAAGCMLDRAEAQVIRLSLIYALVAGHRLIEVEDLVASLAMWDYCYRSTLQIFGAEVIDKNRLKLLDALKTANGSLTRKQIITDVFQGNKSKDVIDSLLDSMVSAGIITITEVQTPNSIKPTSIISLSQNSLNSLNSCGNDFEHQPATGSDKSTMVNDVYEFNEFTNEHPDNIPVFNF
jgi:hypothetical protein